MNPKSTLSHARRGLWIALVSLAAATSASALAANPCASPDGAGGCYAGIQAAIDAVAAGTTIDVYPGAYHEVAANRSVAGIEGTHQFGIFIAKDGITLRGVDASGQPIADWSRAAARITTAATNAFGPSGIFVQGNGVTLSGLSIGANDAGLNKTIEVTGDGFSLLASDIADLNGSVYISDFRFDTRANASYVKSYRIEGNNFRDGASVDIANGAGLSGPVEARVIAGNTFANSKAFPSIAFNGAGTGVAWFVHPVGGAIVEDNVFVNTYGSGDAGGLLRAGHIATRGIVDTAQFDWPAMLASNVFNQAYATYAAASRSDALRSFALSMPEWNACGGATCTFEQARIGATLAGESAIALAGDTTVGRSGTLEPRVYDTY